MPRGQRMIYKSFWVCGSSSGVHLHVSPSEVAQSAVGLGIRLRTTALIVPASPLWPSVQTPQKLSLVGSISGFFMKDLIITPPYDPEHDHQESCRDGSIAEKEDSWDWTMCHSGLPLRHCRNPTNGADVGRNGQTSCLLPGLMRSVILRVPMILRPRSRLRSSVIRSFFFFFFWRWARI